MINIRDHEPLEPYEESSDVVACEGVIGLIKERKNIKRNFNASLHENINDAKRDMKKSEMRIDELKNIEDEIKNISNEELEQEGISREYIHSLIVDEEENIRRCKRRISDNERMLV